MHSLTAKMLGVRAVLAAVLLSGLPVHAATVNNTASVNGSQPQGTSFNGIRMQGSSYQGSTLQGEQYQGVERRDVSHQGQGVQGTNPSGRVAKAADLGAVALRAVRLPDGRVLRVTRN